MSNQSYGYLYALVHNFDKRNLLTYVTCILFFKPSVFQCYSKKILIKLVILYNSIIKIQLDWRPYFKSLDSTHFIDHKLSAVRRTQHAHFLRATATW